ncbi:MAG: hypothetical protein JO279_02610, partial [Verrucomicrobia bacterium]|nr:hypothetical protein [Verrucomicrobiota bacterium]
MELRSVIKIAIRYLAVLVAVVAFIFWQIGPPLHWLPSVPKGQEELGNLLTLVLAFLSALALFEVSRAFDKSEEERTLQRTSNALKRIEDALHKKVDLVKSPSAPTEYIDLWSGFTEKYWVYNPSYRGIEKKPGMDRNKLVNEVFVPRYRDPKFTGAFYLFLTKDHEGQQDLDEFRTLMKEVNKRCPQISKKLEIRELKDEAAAENPEV